YESEINRRALNQITPQQKQQARQLYSQYLESLDKPNTNPILQGNQQEQVKKFTELQERLNNKEFLEGAKNAFESSEELQNVYYEAAGFGQENIEAQKRVKLAYEQLEEARKYVSFEMLNDPEDAEPGDIIYIDDISTEKTQRKKGYATSTYIYIGE